MTQYEIYSRENTQLYEYIVQQQFHQNQTKGLYKIRK